MLALINSAMTSSVTIDKLVTSFLSGRKVNTIRAYNKSLEDFAEFLGVESIAAAASLLLSGHPGDANVKLLDYRTSLSERKLSPATINSRITAVRALVALANRLGLVTWQVQIENVRHEAYRDTRGPGKGGYKRMLDHLAKQNGSAAKRDTAIIHLLFDRGLRRGEVAGMDLDDVDAERSRVRILGKGRSQEEWLTIARPTMQAIQDWIAVRGSEPGPLFCNLDPGHEKGRLSDTSIYRRCIAIGRASGAGHVRPHGLRHAAITHALDRTNGNIRDAAKFARHKRIDTTVRYDDARNDVGGEIAKLIADD